MDEFLRQGTATSDGLAPVMPGSGWPPFPEFPQVFHSTYSMNRVRLHWTADVRRNRRSARGRRRGTPPQISNHGYPQLGPNHVYTNVVVVMEPFHTVSTSNSTDQK